MSVPSSVPCAPFPRDCLSFLSSLVVLSGHCSPCVPSELSIASSCPCPPCALLLSLCSHARLAFLPLLLGSAAVLVFPFYTLFMEVSCAAGDALDNGTDLLICSCAYGLTLQLHRNNQVGSVVPTPSCDVGCWDGCTCYTLNQIGQLMWL